MTAPSTWRRERRTSRLLHDRIATLEAVSGWTWDPKEDDWQEGLAHLRAYVERERRARVPTKHVTGDGYPLGSWIAVRRKERRTGRLLDERIAALDGLPGWSWDPFEDDGQEGLAHFRAYIAREGHAMVACPICHRRWPSARGVGIHPEVAPRLRPTLG
jgi:hypothetical protein